MRAVYTHQDYWFVSFYRIPTTFTCEHAGHRLTHLRKWNGKKSRPSRYWTNNFYAVYSRQENDFLPGVWAVDKIHKADRPYIFRRKHSAKNFAEALSADGFHGLAEARAACYWLPKDLPFDARTIEEWKAFLERQNEQHGPATW